MPIVGRQLVRARVWADRRRRRLLFSGSGQYWDERYAAGGTSGSGSYNRLAVFKAEVLNDFVSRMEVHSVIEWGCGDGNQLLLARYPEYLGLDVSPVAVERCRELFSNDASKRFALTRDCSGEVADLALSLDVVFHLVEDDVYEQYLIALFSSARRYVAVYSSDSDRTAADPHVRHRRFTRDVDRLIAGWRLSRHIPNRYPMRDDPDNESHSEFFFYEHV